MVYSMLKMGLFIMCDCSYILPLFLLIPPLNIKDHFEIYPCSDRILQLTTYALNCLNITHNDDACLSHINSHQSPTLSGIRGVCRLRRGIKYIELFFFNSALFRYCDRWYVVILSHKFFNNWINLILINKIFWSLY